MSVRPYGFWKPIEEMGICLKGLIPTGGILQVEKNYLNMKCPQNLPEHKSDNRILKVCLGLSKEGLKQVILVTKDILLRIKAQLLGIQAEDFTTEQVAGHEEQYLGRKEVFVSEELFKDFKKKGVPVEHVYCCDSNGTCSHPELFENEFVILKADQSSKKTQLGRVEKGVIQETGISEGDAIWCHSKECRAVFSSGSFDAAGRKGTAGHCKRNGRNQ